MSNYFYWNSADDKNHTHQRIEWAIENNYLVMINIKINDKLFSSIKQNDIILAYEPKNHKKSKDEQGRDGYCMSCNYTKIDGQQAFTVIFQVSNNPIILNSLEDEETILNVNLMNNWNTNQNKKHLTNIETYKTHFKTYYQKMKKYIIPVKLIKHFENPITTKKNITTGYRYEKPIVKGFNKLYDCGCCFNNLNCRNSNCIIFNIKIQLHQ